MALFNRDKSSRVMLAPGILLERADVISESDSVYEVNVMLLVDPPRIHQVARTLQELFAGVAHLSPTASAVDLDDTSSVEHFIGADDTGDANSALRALRSHLDSRLDDIDQALRLLVDP